MVGCPVSSPSMLATRTGSFPIGFRRGWSDWQKDISSVISFAKENGFGGIDIGNEVADAEAILAAGLTVGSVDAFSSDLMSEDVDKRAAAVAALETKISTFGAHGIRNYFTVMLPADPKRARRDNFDSMVLGLKALAPILEANNGRLVIEGWPGEGALCCTPETYRATFEAVSSMAIGINYDPSHLIRMGIDPIRFLHEFKDRVYHVHGKDTEVMAEARYEYGFEQQSTFGVEHGFGAASWRYTIPGHGETRWVEVFRILEKSGYDGMVSIELEDENFNGSEEGEKAGLLAGGAYLASC